MLIFGIVMQGPTESPQRSGGDVGSSREHGGELGSQRCAAHVELQGISIFETVG